MEPISSALHVARRIVHMNELLSSKQKRECDRYAIERGVSGLTLMENAGRACRAALLTRWPDKRRISILCGPGNNGGDGFVVARLLADQGHEVRLGSLKPVSDLRGDAMEMAARWTGGVEPLSEDVFDDADIIVDALFGTGLSKPVEGELAELIEAVNARCCPVLSVDVPSGLNGDDGFVRGAAIRADVTVTFFRKMPVHVLMPGRLHCGETIVADIGIPEDALKHVRTSHEVIPLENGPALWSEVFPVPDSRNHKYHRGHAVIVSGGPTSTGAARLAARGALRAGAGLVTIASPSSALLVNAAHVTAVMLSRADDARDIATLLSDDRKNAILIGPGNGVSEETRSQSLAALASAASCVLDADALTVFSDAPETLSSAIEERADRAVVLTPHEGEFLRLFPDLTPSMNKMERACVAAGRIGAIVVLKGADTTIAAPDGRVVVNGQSCAALATAGAGDVLAGIICGLLAQGMPCFDAACAAVWLHGKAAGSFGIGLIAEDIPEQLPAILQYLIGTIPPHIIRRY